MTDLDDVLARVGLRRDDVTPAAITALEDHLQTAPTMNSLIRGRAPVAERVAPSTADDATTAVDALRQLVGDELGLPPVLTDVLRGTTRAELVADADRIVTALSNVEPVPPSTGVPAGPRSAGEPEAPDMNRMMRDITGRNT